MNPPDPTQTHGVRGCRKGNSWSHTVEFALPRGSPSPVGLTADNLCYSMVKVTSWHARGREDMKSLLLGTDVLSSLASGVNQPVFPQRLELSAETSSDWNNVEDKTLLSLNLRRFFCKLMPKNTAARWKSDNLLPKGIWLSETNSGCILKIGNCLRNLIKAFQMLAIVCWLILRLLFFVI